MTEPFSPGADLWVVPDRSHSDWSTALDWYLHFQISRASSRRRRPISNSLHELAKQAEVEVIQPDEQNGFETAPMLIYSARLLPNRETLHLPYTGNINDWLKRLTVIWKDLGEPSLRVFLPRGVKPDHFKGLDSNVVSKASFITDSKSWS